MKIAIDHKREKQNRREFYLGMLVVPLSLAFSFSIIKLAPEMIPRCMLFDKFGVPCPGCGGTRSLESFFNLNVATAFKYNPLSCIFLITLLLYSSYSFATVVFGFPRIRLILNKREKIAIPLFLMAVLAANWLYLMFLR